MNERHHALGLQSREVVDVDTGERLGFVTDVELESDSGRVTALVVPGPFRFASLLHQNGAVVIPWTDVELIGKDVILVHRSGLAEISSISERRLLR